MKFSQKGQVVPGFYVLGVPEMPVYLFNGKRPVLFEAGLSSLGPMVIGEIKALLGRRTPEILFLTHVHFDHCGAAAYLKEAFPKMEIAASAKAAEILTRPNALNLIALLNQNAAEVLRRWHPGIEAAPFKPFTVDRVVSDGDRIDLGDGNSLEVIFTPGHTWDSLSYYLPEQKILISSEAGGCMDNSGEIITEFLVDFEAYVNSIQRLGRLEADIFCQGHRLVFTGAEAKDFFPRSLEATRAHKTMVDNLIEEEKGDIGRVVSRIKALEYDPKPEPKQPEAAYLINLEARVRHLARKKGY